MFSNDEAHAALDSFFHDGLISAVLYEVKSGKEATVFCCRGADSQLPDLVAAKIYRPGDRRSFRRNDIYQAGRVEFAKNTRLRRALQSGSSFGRAAELTLWVHHEWTLLTQLFECGIPIPAPIACGEKAILMEFCGTEEAPAPMLAGVELPVEIIERVTDELLTMIEVLLDVHCVHGDLSPYNVIWWNERPMLIDVPQAVDPRLNPAAQGLLHRDVANVCAWAAKHGVDRPAAAIAEDLWSRFLMGELG